MIVLRVVFDSIPLAEVAGIPRIEGAFARPLKALDKKLNNHAGFS